MTRVLRVVLVALALANGAMAAAPTVAWRQKLSGYVDKPSCADLDGDGRLEVVVGTTDGTVAALAGSSGAVLWTYHNEGERYLASPLAADVDGDGSVEIIVTGSRLGSITTLNGEDGIAQWAKPATGVPIDGSAALGDLDGDGRPELLVAQGQAVRCLDAASGSERWSAPMPSVARGSVAIADINGDGLLEVLTGLNDGRVVCLDGLGNLLWATVVRGIVTKTPVVADGDGDGRAQAYVIGQGLHRIGATGQLVWTWNPPSGRGLSSSLAAADLDGDRRPELLACGYDGSLYAVSSAGKLRWKFTIVPRGRDGTVPFVPSSTPALVDVTGDGVLDAIVASPQSDDPKLFAVDGRTGQAVWRATLASYSQGCPLVADVDGDGRPEIIIGDATDRVYAFKLGARVARGWVKYNGDLASTGGLASAMAAGAALLAGRSPFPVQPQTVNWSPEVTAPPPATTPGDRPVCDIAVMLDGTWLYLEPAAVSVEGRVLVPLRGIFEAMAAEVKYDPATRTITATQRDRTVTLTIGSKQAFVGGAAVELSVPAQIIGASTYVPLRFVGEAFGATVKWDAVGRNVEITR